MKVRTLARVISPHHVRSSLLKYKEAYAYTYMYGVLLYKSTLLKINSNILTVSNISVLLEFLCILILQAKNIATLIYIVLFLFTYN